MGSPVTLAHLGPEEEVPTSAIIVMLVYIILIITIIITIMDIITITFYYCH
jgi:hypothetical protein